MSQKAERKQEANIAYQTGISDYFRGKSIKESPFKKSSFEHGFWIQGHRVASKSDRKKNGN